MRKAIGEYTFGFDDLEAHSLRQKLYEANKAFDKLEDELKTNVFLMTQTARQGHSTGVSFFQKV